VTATATQKLIQGLPLLLMSTLGPDKALLMYGVVWNSLACPGIETH